MSYLFYGYSSLISLPDISKWNTNNATSMKGILSLPQISKLNTNKVFF
jgi:surface protein